MVTEAEKQPHRVGEKEVDRENKATGQKDNLLVDPRGDLLPPIIRPEINSLNFPFFALHRRGLKSRIETVYRFVEERDGARAELEWRVTANAKYGHPSPFDYRVSRAVDALIYEVLAQDGYHWKILSNFPFTILQS